MGKNLDVSIVIVSFNTRNLTVDCIRSIVSTVKNHSYEIIVSDNDSYDDSTSAVKELAHEVENLSLIENKKNLGFSKANNVGVRQSSGRYVLFLNSDTIVHPKTIDGMIDFMDKNPTAGASTCFLRMPNGELDDAAHRGFPTPWRALTHFSNLSKVFPKSKIFSGYNQSFLDITKTHEIEVLAGAFMLVRREAGEAVGWWDEDYFFYGEDVDFCYELRKAGWKIYFVPDFEILHYKGASGGIKKNTRNISIATDETKKRAQEERFRAMRIFYDKHYKKKYPGIIRTLVFSGIKLKQTLTR